MSVPCLGKEDRAAECLGRARLIDASAGKLVRILMTFIGVTTSSNHSEACHRQPNLCAIS